MPEHIWAMYFSSICGFQYHPRNPPAERMKLEDCALIADRMAELHMKRFGGKNGLDGRSTNRG